MIGTLKYLLGSLFLTSISVCITITKSNTEACFGLFVSGMMSMIYLLKLLFPNARFLKGLKTTDAKPDSRSFEEIYNDNGIFEYTSDGFIITTEGDKKEIKWNYIETILGYKVDLYTSDTICLDVFCGNESFRITEETLGWYQFVLRSKEAFSQINKTWDTEITIPAFETKLTLVYDRENRTLEDAMQKYKKG